MRLVTASAGTCRTFARVGMLEQVRDLGRTLEYALAHYDRIVREMTGTDIPSPDFEGRIQVANREVADVATRLQELFVLEHEARRAEAYAAFEPVAAAPRKPAPRTPASVIATPRRPRRPSLDRFVPIVAQPRFGDRVVAQ